jgi:sulfur carrier protein ThiS
LVEEVTVPEDTVKGLMEEVTVPEEEVMGLVEEVTVPEDTVKGLMEEMTVPEEEVAMGLEEEVVMGLVKVANTLLEWGVVEVDTLNNLCTAYTNTRNSSLNCD